MAYQSQSEVEKKLNLLQVEFKRTLAEKITLIENLWNSVLTQEGNGEIVEECHRVVHSLAGSGGTFGATLVSAVSQELVIALKSILNLKNLSSDSKSSITALILKLKTVADEWKPSTIPYLKPLEDKGKRKGNLIYIAEDDELLAKELASHLKDDNFIVKCFSDLESFDAAFHQEMPSAVVIDYEFKEKGFTGADSIVKLKNEFNHCPPIVFISARNDIEARLAAAKAGAQRYLKKPLNNVKLSQTLDGLIGNSETSPFRILLVDDDISILEYYKTILIDAGLDVRTLSNPMNSLEVIEQFKPDVIVLDVYMAECEGPQIAQVIRQDDRWALTPIMFLSSEKNLGLQLESMHLGGESFMVKPIADHYLVKAIRTKAKHSRWSHRLNNDLKRVVRENEYQLITSNNHNIVSTADIGGTILSVNDQFCEITGYSADELIGQNHRILKSYQHSDSFYKNMWETISNGGVWKGRICNVNKKGKEYWVESTIVPFLNENGKPYKYVSARTDVTQVIQSEERLERSQKFANIGTWDWNLETGKVYWSERIWDLFGYDRKTTDTNYENFMLALHPDDRDFVAEAVTQCVEKGKEYNVEHRVVWPDGSIHWLHESGDVVRDKNGKALHMLGVVQEITLRKEAEHSLLDATEEAVNANRAKSQFLSSMSHELRTPMNAIMGFGQLLGLEHEQALTKDQKENLNEILKASDHLLELINEVLDLAQIEAGRIDLSIEDVNIANVISESLQLILPLANKRGISIKLLRDDTEYDINDLDSEEHYVRADYTRTKQVLINLLSNAVKYNSENGNITIKYEAPGEHCTRISVIDTGEGLSQSQQEQLFTAFNRLGAENSEIEGTGIGLVITKNIVDLMGGQIDAESHVGEGTTFWFELPSSSGGLVVDENNESLSEINMELTEERTVLYIEDNPANLRLVTQLLGHLPNLHMWSAHEPLLGLELAEENNPDLILLDINLPGMDGFEVLKLLKGRDTTRNTPIIAISANAMPKDIEKGFAAGFDDYITKPINISKLLKTVEEKLVKEK